MVDVVANQRGYLNGILRDEGERFSLPDDLWSDKERRPSWVTPVKGATVKVDPAPPVVAETGGVALADMSAADLRQYAKDHGIDLNGARSKADMIEAIEAVSVTEPEVAPFAEAPVPQHITASNEVKDATTGPAPDWIAPGQDI